MQGEYRLQVNLQTGIRQDREVVLYPTPSKETRLQPCRWETWSKGPVETLNCLVTLLSHKATQPSLKTQKLQTLSHLYGRVLTSQQKPLNGRQLP